MAIAWRGPRMRDQETASSVCTDDDALAAGAQANPSAFAALWECHVDGIYRYCLNELRNPEEAEDATNTVFLKAFAARDQYRIGRNSFRSWLYTIAHNEIASR